MQHRWVDPQAALPKVPLFSEAGPPEMNDAGGFSMMQMDEEPVYRTLDPDIMSVDTAAFEEEPVYRSVDLDMAPPALSTSSSSECSQKDFGFACKPCYQFTTSTPASELLTKV